jgi:tetratricopeptide (TPR) repeat protein
MEIPPDPLGDPRLTQAAASLDRNDADGAMSPLAVRIGEHPHDAHALNATADRLKRSGRYGESEALLVRALAAAPRFAEARFNLALVLHRQDRFEAALIEVERLLADEPTKLAYLSLKAAVLVRLARYEAAIDIYGAMLARAPVNARGWMRYGHVLRTVGRSADCIAAYRQAINHEPSLAEAWWSLANLKTYRFRPGDVPAMRAALNRADLRSEDRFYFHIALGKALEDDQQYRSAFDHYASGNALRRAQVRWDADGNRAHVAACERVLTEGFFAERQGVGWKAVDPIFIVGLPRSGSTLIEQILASHSQVEGTRELPDVTTMARELGESLPGTKAARYLDALTALSAGQVEALGRTYLDRTRIHRKTDKPRFIDKMPNNFNFTGLIHLMLPNATIIDARRHPMATCFSAWKQAFASGQTFTYDLEELGRYYRDYVDLMAHFDRVLPGRVLRVNYENLVADTSGEVLRILAHCGLAFEPGCLAFYENARPVRTASSEQVRQPISTDGLDHWRRFEPWLRDLQAQLGPVPVNCGNVL